MILACAKLATQQVYVYSHFEFIFVFMTSDTGYIFITYSLASLYVFLGLISGHIFCQLFSFDGLFGFLILTFKISLNSPLPGMWFANIFWWQFVFHLLTVALKEQVVQSLSLVLWTFQFYSIGKSALLQSV